MNKKIIFTVLVILAIIGGLIYFAFSGSSKNEDVDPLEIVEILPGEDISVQLDHVTRAVLSSRAVLLTEQDSIAIADEIIYKKEAYVIPNSFNNLSELEIGDVIIYPYTKISRGYILQKISENGKNSYFEETDLSEAFSSLNIELLSMDQLTSEDIKIDNAKFLSEEVTFNSRDGKLFVVSYEIDSLNVLSESALKEPHTRCVSTVTLIWGKENGVDLDGNTIYEDFKGLSAKGDVTYIIPQNKGAATEYKGQVEYSAENMKLVTEYNSESGTDRFVNDWAMMTYDEVVVFNIETVDGNGSELNEAIIENMKKELSFPITQLKISLLETLGLEIPFEVSVGYYQGEDGYFELAGNVGYRASGQISIASHVYTEHDENSREYQDIQKVKEVLSSMDQVSETALKGNQDAYFNYALDGSYLYGDCRIDFENIYVGPKLLIGMGLANKEPLWDCSLVAGLNLTIHAEGEMLLNFMDPLEQTIASIDNTNAQVKETIYSETESTFGILTTGNVNMKTLKLSSAKAFQSKSSYGLKLSNVAKNSLSYDLLELMAIDNVDLSEYTPIGDQIYKHEYAPFFIQLSQDGRIEKISASMYATNYDIGNALKGNETLNNMMKGINDVFPVMDTYGNDYKGVYENIYNALIENSLENSFLSTEKSGSYFTYNMKHFQHMDKLYDITLVAQQSTGRLMAVTIVNSNPQADLRDVDLRVSVSSTLKELFYGTTYIYKPEYMFDHDIFTMWSEGAENGGEGEWIKIGSDETFYLESVLIQNGFTESFHSYKENNRLIKVRIISDKGDDATFTLEDENLDFQRIPLDFGLVKWVKLEVVEISAGATYNDLSLSEVILNNQFIQPVIEEMNIVPRTQ